MAVRRRGSGWLVTIELGRDPATGKRRRAHLTTTTRREAEREFAKRRHDVDTGLEIEPTRLTLSQYIERWLSTARVNLAPTTHHRYEGLIHHQVIPYIGHVSLAKLRPIHVQQLYAQLRADGRVDGNGGLAAKTILQVHHVLSRALGQAVRWQLLPRNVCQAVQAPQTQRKELRTLDLEGAQRLAAEAEAEDNVCGDAVVVALHSGLRMGELLALRWDDVDLEQGRLVVQRALQFLRGSGFSFRQPKTAGSRRTVPLGTTALDALRRARVRQLQERLIVGPAYKDQGLVFATALGTPIFHSNLRRAFQRLLISADIGRLRFHDLRHTHASLLLARGVHPKIVSERLGHASISITLDTYSHVLPGLQEDAVRDLDAWLAGRA